MTITQNPNNPSRDRSVRVVAPVDGHTPRVKVYRLHHCGAKHRSVRTFLKCAIPRAEWVTGTGDYALIAWCKVPTVTLHRTLDVAAQSKAAIDSGGCGGRCAGRHEVVLIDLGERRRKVVFEDAGGN